MAMDPANLPDKKKGDYLEAEHINALNRAAKDKFKLSTSGHFVSLAKAGEATQLIQHPPWYQFAFRITKKISDTKYKGIVRFWDEEDEEWKPNQTEFRQFLEYGFYGDNVEPDEWNMDSGHTEKLYDIGDKVYVYFDPQVSSYVPVEDAAIRNFELKGDLDTYVGADVKAYLRAWDFGENTWHTDETEEITVYDRYGVFQGRGKHSFPSPNDNGSYGIAVMNTVKNEWEIVSMQPTALWLVGTLASTMSSSSPPASGSLSADPDVAFPVGAIITDQDPGASMQVANPLYLWGGSGSHAECKWNDADNRWEFIAINSHVSQDVVTDVFCDDDDIVVCTTQIDFYPPTRVYTEVCP